MLLPHPESFKEQKVNHFFFKAKTPNHKNMHLKSKNKINSSFGLLNALFFPPSMVEKHLLILSLCAADLSPYLLMRSPIYMWVFFVYFLARMFLLQGKS